MSQIKRAFNREFLDDRVAALLVAGNAIDLVYNDPANTLTISVQDIYIKKDGTTTTTASIPFALGLSVPDNQYGYFGSSPGTSTGVSNQLGYLKLFDSVNNDLGDWYGYRTLYIATQPISALTGDGLSSSTAYYYSSPPIYIQTGNATGNNTVAGDIRIEPGSGTTNNSSGGGFYLRSGNGFGSGPGGQWSLSSGNGGTSNGYAGSVTFLGGLGYGSGTGATILFIAGGKGAAGTGSAGNISFVGGQNLFGGGGTAGSVFLLGGQANPGINYGYIGVRSSGTPNKFSLTTTATRSSLYVENALEVDGVTYLDGALNVVGTTTLATSLSGLANLASGVVSAITSTQGDIFYASAANTVSKLAKDTNATRYLSNTGSSNNPAWAQVDLSNGVTGVLPVTSTSLSVTSPITYSAGVVGFDFSTNNTWTGTQYINLSNTAALKVGSTPTFQVNTTNGTLGYGAAPGTTIFETVTPTSGLVFGTLYTQTFGAATAGMYNLNFVDTWNWSGAAITAVNSPNVIKATITDSHTVTSGTIDTSRFMTVAWTRSGTQDVSGPSIITPQMLNLTLTDNGIYNKTNANTTVNPNPGGVIIGSFAPTYNDGGVGRTMTYTGVGQSILMSFSPTITSGTITHNLRGFYIISLTGSTIANVNTTSYAAAFEAASISNTYNGYGLKITALSASTLAAGVAVTSVSGATTSYGVKIDAVAGATTAIGLGVTAIPTTATNKYQVALDGTGTGSGIYFDTPTIAGTQYIRAASATALEVGAPTSVNIASGYLYLTSTSADPTNGFQMYFYKPNYDLSASGKYGGFGEWHVTTPGANGFYGLQFTAQTDHTSGTQSGGMSAVNANVNIFHTGTGADSGSHNAGNYQITNYSALNSSGTWTAILGRIANNAAGNINVARSFSALNYLSGAGNVTTSINYYAQGFSDGGAGALTNNYGIYVEELTAGSTINREIFIAGAGGTYFRDGNQKIYSSAASTLDVTANTTYQERIGGTVQTTLTSDLLTLKDSFNIAVNTGTGTKIGTSSAQKIGLWNATPVAQHSSTGETVGFTAGAGTNVTDASTFTGNVGATAYRISDIVKALKNAGIMAQ